MKILNKSTFALKIKEVENIVLHPGKVIEVDEEEAKRLFKDFEDFIVETKEEVKEKLEDVPKGKGK